MAMAMAIAINLPVKQRWSGAKEGKVLNEGKLRRKISWYLMAMKLSIKEGELTLQMAKYIYPSGDNFTFTLLPDSSINVALEDNAVQVLLKMKLLKAEDITLNAKGRKEH